MSKSIGCQILSKDCNLSTKSSYWKNLTHARQIWLSYNRPKLNLDGFLHHSKKYKVAPLPFVSFNSFLDIFPYNVWFRDFFDFFLLWFIMQHFEEMLKHVFNVRLIKEYMSIFLLLDLVFNLWETILV